MNTRARRTRSILRELRENARRGFFNGSRAPFGYRVIDTEALGNRGRCKKKLAINEGEAELVRNIYDLYLHGLEGRSMGFKEIAKHLNERQLRMRGGVWGIQKIHKGVVERHLPRRTVLQRHRLKDR